MRNKKAFISDWITEQEVGTWIPGDIIMIVANTGRGKSYFIKNVLRKHLQEKGLNCLYLLSRLRTKEQFESELPDDDTIRFMTYQAVESIKSNPFAGFSGWDVIIADECHYFLDDSSFNSFTDVSLDWILEQHKAIRVLMTATGDGIEEYLNEQRIMYTQYRIDGDYDQVRNLTFFWKEHQLFKLAERIITSGEKGLFFIQSAEKAHSLYEQFKHNGMFLCSSYNKNFAKYMDEERISELLENEHFDCSILFATTALDTGVNLKDTALTNIVIDVTEPVRVIQCIGRKRFINEDDYVDLYIRGRSNMQIGGLIKNLQERADIVKGFIEHGAISYNAANGRRNDGTGLIFDTPEMEGHDKPLFSKRINKLKYAQIRQNIRMYRNMLALGEFGYAKYIAQLLYKGDYTILEEDLEQQSLTKYLKSISDIPLLTMQEREPLIERLDVRRNRRLCKSYRVLAAWLESSGLPYRLLEYSTSRLIAGRKKNYTAWKIVCLE